MRNAVRPGLRREPRRWTLALPAGIRHNWVRGVVGEFVREMIRARLTRHAEWELNRRSIPLAFVQVVMDHPEQRLADESQTIVGFFNRAYGSEMGNYIYCDS